MKSKLTQFVSRMVQIRGVQGGGAEAYSKYAAQADDAANEEDGPSSNPAGSRMVQIRGVQGGGAEAYSVYAAQADDAANEEDGPFLSPLLLCCFLLAILIPPPVLANFVVKDILSDREIVIRSSEDQHLAKGDWLLLRSQEETIGVVEIVRLVERAAQSENARQRQKSWLARVVRFYGNRLVYPGMELIRGKFDQANTQVEANTKLLGIQGKEDVLPQYRPTVYQGVMFEETAEQPRQGEVIFDWYQTYIFGLDDRLSLKSNFYLFARHYLNAAVKYQFYRADEMRLATSFQFMKTPEATQIYKLSLFSSVPSNSNFIYHTAVEFTGTDNTQAASNEVEKAWLSSHFSTTTEYILGNWDRVFLGPSYNFAEGKFGGSFAYLRIWGKTHLLMGVEVQDVTNFELSLAGYLPFFSAFWRI